MIITFVFMIDKYGKTFGMNLPGGLSPSDIFSSSSPVERMMGMNEVVEKPVEMQASLQDDNDEEPTPKKRFHNAKDYYKGYLDSINPIISHSNAINTGYNKPNMASSRSFYNVFKKRSPMSWNNYDNALMNKYRWFYDLMRKSEINRNERLAHHGAPKYLGKRLYDPTGASMDLYEPGYGLKKRSSYKDYYTHQMAEDHGTGSDEEEDDLYALKDLPLSGLNYANWNNLNMFRKKRGNNPFLSLYKFSNMLHGLHKDKRSSEGFLPESLMVHQQEKRHGQGNPFAALLEMWKERERNEKREEAESGMETEIEPEEMMERNSEGLLPSSLLQKRHDHELHKNNPYLNLYEMIMNKDKRSQGHESNHFSEHPYGSNTEGFLPESFLGKRHDGGNPLLMLYEYMKENGIDSQTVKGMGDGLENFWMG